MTTTEATTTGRSSDDRRSTSDAFVEGFESGKGHADFGVVFSESGGKDVVDHVEDTLLVLTDTTVVGDSRAKEKGLR